MSKRNAREIAQSIRDVSRAPTLRVKLEDRPRAGLPLMLLQWQFDGGKK